MLHSGIDLHKRTIVLSTIDPAGTRVADAEVPTSRVAVRAYFAPHLGPHSISMDQAVIDEVRGGLVRPQYLGFVGLK